MSRGHDNPDPAAPQTRCGPRFLLPSSLSLLPLSLVSRISRLVDLYRLFPRPGIRPYAMPSRPRFAARDLKPVATRHPVARALARVRRDGTVERDGRGRGGGGKRDGIARVSSWERERFLADERTECRDTLVACVGEQRRNGCGDGISLSFPCPRRDVRCPARAIEGGRKPPSHTERRQFPRTVEVGSSRTRARSATPRGLSRLPMLSRETERAYRHLGSSHAGDT